MIVGPGKIGQGPVKLFWKLSVSVVVTLLLYEGMVTAFHLPNLPINLAVLAGMSMLLLLAAGECIVFRSIWNGALPTVQTGNGGLLMELPEPDR